VYHCQRASPARYSEADATSTRRYADAPAAKWRVSRDFKRKSPASDVLAELLKSPKFGNLR
jgi:hypothetical protein